ncbi:ATP-binding cassette domain-containing protein [Paraburkholderia sp. CNPSo 3155]|uniref:ABC transporter ATP-binding protein n=1 Tax=Paraburkholderia atlantica TaxID=2654982 RepID=UPI00128DE2A3|nr:ABC transporter ATP-binding protein [Paraburkholderia atlantica]MPW08950.1 ATP-binding cassette domain-containing protein [Paraburkholderia atlantica]
MAENPGGLNLSVVSVRGLMRRFGDRTILDRIDLNIQRGEFVAMLGRSGSGKSTFLRALAGLDHEVAGGGSLAVPDRLSVVFQDARLLPWKRLVENVTFGLAVERPQERAREALTEVGLAGRERAWPQELSGGEQQRVALARALAREPELLLADEPFGALDALTRLRMHALLRRLCDRHRPAVLLVTHDVDEAIHLADRVVVLDQGKLVVDVTVGLPATQPRREARVVELRERLLASLGVEAELSEKARAVA